MLNTWTMGRCIVYTGIFVPLSFHFSLPFSRIKKLFATLFSGTMRPRILKLRTHVDSRQMYRVYRNQAAALICPFISFFFLSNFQALKIFVTLFSGTARPRRLKLGTHVDRCIVYTGIRLLLLIRPLFLHFSFSPIFKH